MYSWFVLIKFVMSLILVYFLSSSFPQVFPIDMVQYVLEIWLLMILLILLKKKEGNAEILADMIGTLLSNIYILYEHRNKI